MSDPTKVESNRFAGWALRRRLFLTEGMYDSIGCYIEERMQEARDLMRFSPCPVNAEHLTWTCSECAAAKSREVEELKGLLRDARDSISGYVEALRTVVPGWEVHPPGSRPRRVQVEEIMREIDAADKTARATLARIQAKIGGGA